MRLGSLILLLSLLCSPLCAYDLNVDDPESIKYIASRIAFKMMSYYHGNESGQTPGMLPQPYYWWEAGAAFGALIDYWYFTGDDSYNPATTQAMLWQVGPDEDYMPPNVTSSLGNDDQAFWGLAAMAAAEKNYPDPPEGEPQWLALAQAVFNTQVARWDTKYCEGGLRWQVFTFNGGYNYKNTVSNGCLFLLAARLARYTGNSTYMDWAEKVWDWTRASGLMGDDFRLYDGGSITDCVVGDAKFTKIDLIQWTYNAGMYLAGAAYLFNFTTAPDWRDRVNSLLQQTAIFFRNGTVLYEAACEPYYTCNVDQQSFKGYLSRFMALTVQMAPWTAEFILPKLKTSAVAAAEHCSFGDDGNNCALRWWDWDIQWKFTGVGEQMAALETIHSLLVEDKSPPVTEDEGGTSQGNPAAGGTNPNLLKKPPETKTKDRAGAWTLTVLMGIVIALFCYWIGFM